MAKSALQSYPIQVDELKFVKLSANAIFRVKDNRNHFFQLRINPGYSQSYGALQDEIKWLSHLKCHTSLRVPTPMSCILHFKKVLIY